VLSGLNAIPYNCVAPDEYKISKLILVLGLKFFLIGFVTLDFLIKVHSLRFDRFL